MKKNLRIKIVIYYTNLVFSRDVAYNKFFIGDLFQLAI